MRKILVIDDNIVMLALIEKVLDEKDWQVITSEDEDNVFELAMFHKPDIMLLDVSLTHSDGRNICQSLKLEPVFKDLRIVLFSGFDMDPESVADAYADDFIEKPFSVNELCDVLEQYAGKVLR